MGRLEISNNLIINNMQKLVEQIVEKSTTFITESNKQLDGNSTAGGRARKASLELEKLFKKFRKQSVVFKKQ